MATELIEHDGWTLRIRRPETPGPYRVALLLHGWKGTEDVMWVFAGQLPENVLLVAPRAPFFADEGYSWVRERTAGFSDLEQFEYAVEELETLCRSLGQLFHADFDHIHLMGFSQGAAACFAWAALFPNKVESLAALAGFLPAGVPERLNGNPLAEVPVFIAHGTLDTTVPIEKMRTAAKRMEESGADVSVCEDEVGHKLSSNCMRSLGAFYAKVFAPREGH